MPVNPHQILSPQRVVDLRGATKEEVLAEMVGALATSPNVTNARDLLEKVLEREEVLSTGVGVGLALPHVKIASVKDFVVGVGRHRAGVDFDAIDGEPVHLVVMIGCNESQSADYLKVLSKVVRSLKEKAFQDRLMAAAKPADVVALFLSPEGPFGTP